MRTIEEIDAEFNEVKKQCNIYAVKLKSYESIEEFHEALDKSVELLQRLSELDTERNEAILHRLDHKLTDMLQSAINVVFGVES